jgi:hypothetical protein
MVTPKFRRRDGTAVDKAPIEAFRHGFQGQVLLPGDAGLNMSRHIGRAHFGGAGMEEKLLALSSHPEKLPGV